MILFQQMDFKSMDKILKILIIGVQAVFALQIEAPSEIAEQVLAYSNEATGTTPAATNINSILRVSITKNTQCNTFTLKLIDKYSGKTIKKVERCSANLPNAILQDAVFELFGHKGKNSDNSANSGLRTALLGISFAAAGILLYYSNPPKPVYGTQQLSEVKK